MKLIPHLFVFIFFLSSCSKDNIELISIGNDSSEPVVIKNFNLDAKPKNIILIIGDGTGLNQITLSRIAIGGPDYRLAIDQMPYTGFSLTHADNAIVTDSDASATSWAAGIKTTNKFLFIFTKQN